MSSFAATHSVIPNAHPNSAASLHVEATTVLAFRYNSGVLIAGDRRATAGNLLMYDRADKVIELDDQTVMAIAGTPATAFEMARILQTNFQYFRRSQLQPLSMAAKVRSLAQLIKNNLALTLQGVGIVVPILIAKDSVNSVLPTIFFYDALGAQFQAVDFTTSGSGSPSVRSLLQWVNRWSGQPTSARNEEQALTLALQMLDVAAESDTATGGVDRRSLVFPQVAFLTADGLRHATEEQIKKVFLEMETLSLNRTGAPANA